MVILGNKTLCSSCFAPIKKEPCKKCGFHEPYYKPENMVLPAGTVLMGNFLIGKVLGKGGFGITYLAYDVKFDKIIAIKEYFPIELAIRKSGDTGLMVRDRESAELFKKGVSRFYNEASFVAKFSKNPNIVKVYQFFYENDTAYFTMELLTGITLKDYVNRVGKLTAGQALYVADMIAYAFIELHREKILHRDVSPDNIMLCADGSVKLLDFGSARQVYSEGSQLLSVVLKPGFAPIEQYMRSGKQGEWSDIYSLAASLYFGLTGQIPENPQNRLEDDWDMENNVYNIQPEVWSLLDRAMKVKYLDRFQSTEEFRQALAAVPVKRQGVRVPSKLPPEGADEDNPIKKLIAKLFGG